MAGLSLKGVWKHFTSMIKWAFYHDSSSDAVLNPATPVLSYIEEDIILEEGMENKRCGGEERYL